MKHYHALAGLHGYLPNMNEPCDNYEDAVECLVQVHELGEKRAAKLMKYGYIELNLKRDGNEYAEVSECEESECEQDLAV